jgi:DNA-directed RNA polymerase specialized sigma subunit
VEGCGVSSDELRIEVLRLRNTERLSLAKTAARLGISKSYAHKLEHAEKAADQPARRRARAAGVRVVETLAAEASVSSSLPLEVLAAMAVLDNDERQAFIDSELLGRSFRAIAADLGCSHNHVLTLKRRAQRRLERELLADVELVA